MLCRHCKGGKERRAAIGMAVCKLPLPECADILRRRFDFPSRRLRFFFNLPF